MKPVSFLVAALLASPALAADKTVALDVPGMDCALCPITVKKALSRVSGVSRIAVSLEKKEAVVTYDDARTSVDALRRATADAGYPSTAKP
jgi:mercuric ion binding protein